MANPIINIENLTKVYKNELFGKQKIVALQNVTLDIYEGEIFAILGVNGAGKTTLTKCMFRLVRSTNGEIRISEKLLTPNSSPLVIC